MVKKSEIISAVREHLDRHPLDSISLDVLDRFVRRENGWWYVPVQPSERIERISPYYEVLAEVEEELDAEKGLNILLVPTLPDS